MNGGGRAPAYSHGVCELPPDPRISHAHVTGGPADLVGNTVVIVDAIHVGGQEVHIPRPLAGIPELVACRAAEERAEELRKRMFATLIEQGPAPWQPNTTLVIEMRSAAETLVTSAVVGLEAFCSHHVLRCLDESGKVTFAREQLTPQEVRDRYSLDERYKLVLPELLRRPKPSGTKWWQVFRRTQGLAALTRHAVTEPVRRNGLTGERSLAERFYTGEHVGTARMLYDCFEHFSPNWVPEALRS
jgi:hypothetical protein